MHWNVFPNLLWNWNWLLQSRRLSLVSFMVLTNITPNKLFDLSPHSLPIKICLDSLKCLHLPFMCASMKLLDNIMWEVKSKWKKNTFLIQHKSVHNLLGSSLMTSTQWKCRNRLDKASTTILSPPFLYSMLKSNPKVLQALIICTNHKFPFQQIASFL